MLIKIGSRYFGVRYVVLAEDQDPTAPPPRPMRIILEDGLSVYLNPDESDQLRRRLDGLSGEPPEPSSAEGPAGPGSLPSILDPPDDPPESDAGRSGGLASPN
jgi:hypothetical protein